MMFGKLNTKRRPMFSRKFGVIVFCYYGISSLIPMTVQSKPSHFSIVTPLVSIEREIFIQPGDILTAYYFN